MRGWARSGGGFVLIGLAAVACVGLVVWMGARATAGSAAAAPASVSASADPVHPRTKAQLKTTDGGIALDNLNARIKGFEAHAARRPNDAAARAGTSELYAARGRYLASIADYERADAAAEDAVRAEPTSRVGYLARAASRAGLHRFEEALADLATAEEHGAKVPETRPLRAAILQGQGDLDGALALRRADREAYKTIVSLGSEAGLLGEMGKIEEASALFREAVETYRDVSPLPVAWISFQHGVLWEKEGKKDRAKAFFADAHARLPSYVHAASHLASLMSPAEGAKLLAPYVATSDDPEIEAVYAERLRASGDAEGGARARAHARARYEELMAKHPAAFAEHAGWFFLDEPNGAARALELAKQNLEVRRTESAYRLGLLAAIASTQKEAACELGQKALALPHPSEMLRNIASGTCKH